MQEVQTAVDQGSKRIVELGPEDEKIRAGIIGCFSGLLQSGPIPHWLLQTLAICVNVLMAAKLRMMVLL